MHPAVLFCLVLVGLLLGVSPNRAHAETSGVIERAFPAVVDIAVEKTRSPQAWAKPASSDRGNVQRSESPSLDRPWTEDQVRQLSPKSSSIPLSRERSEIVGAGFVFDSDGLIVTSEHVIHDARRIFVTFADGRRIAADVVGADPLADLAVIRVNAGRPLPALRFADSRSVKLASPVVAIGNPFGFGHSVTTGAVSGLGRITPDNDVMGLIQHDAALNLGNSGGPLLNPAGDVIGVNTAIFSPAGAFAGLSFAIPAHLAEPVVRRLARDGHASGGTLGVKTQGLTPEVGEALGMETLDGAVVVDVDSDGPGARAGLRIGDVIVRFDGMFVRTPNDVTRLVYHAAAGHTATVEVLRDRQRLSVEATVVWAAIPAVASPESSPSSLPVLPRPEGLGLELAAIDSRTRGQFGLLGDLEGLVVVSVAPDGPAAVEGLRPGDVLVAIGRLRPKTPREVTEAIEAEHRAGRSAVALLVHRGHERQYIAVRFLPEAK